MSTIYLHHNQSIQLKNSVRYIGIRLNVPKLLYCVYHFRTYLGMCLLKNLILKIDALNNGFFPVTLQ